MQYNWRLWTLFQFKTPCNNFGFASGPQKRLWNNNTRIVWHDLSVLQGLIKIILRVSLKIEKNYFLTWPMTWRTLLKEKWTCNELVFFTDIWLMFLPTSVKLAHFIPLVNGHQRINELDNMILAVGQWWITIENIIVWNVVAK